MWEAQQVGGEFAKLQSFMRTTASVIGTELKFFNMNNIQSEPFCLEKGYTGSELNAKYAAYFLFMRFLTCLPLWGLSSFHLLLVSFKHLVYYRPSVILGVTNPFFAKTLQHWPHIIRIGDIKVSGKVFKLIGDVF